MPVSRATTLPALVVVCLLSMGCRTGASGSNVRAWSSSTPPDLSSHVLVQEEIRGPTVPTLLPYVGQRPLVRVVQRGNRSPAPASPSFDLVVFADGSVFFEGQRCAATLGLAKTSLDAEQMRGLRALLKTGCPALTAWGPSFGPSASVDIDCQWRPERVVPAAGVEQVVYSHGFVESLRLSEDDFLRAAALAAKVIEHVRGASATP